MWGHKQHNYLTFAPKCISNALDMANGNVDFRLCVPLVRDAVHRIVTLSIPHGVRKVYSLSCTLGQLQVRPACGCRVRLAALCHVVHAAFGLCILMNDLLALDASPTDRPHESDVGDLPKAKPTEPPRRHRATHGLGPGQSDEVLKRARLHRWIDQNMQNECDDECDSDADQHSLNTTFETVGKMRCTCASLHASLFFCYLGFLSYSLDLVPFLEVQSQGDHSSNFQRRFLRIQVVFRNTSSQLAIGI